MKSALFLSLILLSISAIAQDCYPFKNSKICIPQIGQKLESPAALPSLIKKLLNQSANYSGPNCYNAALIAAGVMKENEVRYVSPEEFESVLKNNYQEVSSPQTGDIVVYEANSGRGHVSYYLGNDLVFHKKSYHKNYLYRVVPMEEVGKIEKGEWQPSPWEDIPAWTDENIGKTAKAFYRLKSSPLRESYTAIDKKWLELVALINNQLIKDGPNWAVGKNMGLVSENFLNAAIRIVQKDKVHPAVIAKMISLKDQIYQSLEEMYFSRARGQRQVNDMNEEICFADNQYTKDLIMKVATVLNKDAAKLSEDLKKSDRIKCKVDLISIF